METPEIRWAKRGDLHIAYYTAGKAPPDIIYVPNWTNNIEIFWDDGPFGRLIKPLSAFGRVIAFDQPGTGISDPVALNDLPPMESWMDDVRAVMDAAECERAALVSVGPGCALASLFAAAHPERVTALAMMGGFARMLRDDDYPAGFPKETAERGMQGWLDVWGTGLQLTRTAPSVANDEQEIRIMARAERHSASPGVARKYFELITHLDVRHVLPAIRVPTLIVHRTGDRWIRVEHARYLAEHISGAKLVEIPGDDHFFMYRDTDLVMAEIREFLTGVRTEPENPDRVLATLLFTDIVGSTERAAAMGDRQWRDVLDEHDRSMRILLDRFNGREVTTTGDGFFATFDGPARAVRCAQAARNEARRLGLEIRAGLHAGECEVRGEDVGGIAVHVGARVSSRAGAGEILVSQTVKDLTIGSALRFEERGVHTLKGVPGEWRLYAVT